MIKKKKSLEFEERPWGTFTVLEEGRNFKIKRIEVFPEKRSSYQKHQHRAEHWLIVQGIAKVTLDDEVHEVSVGQAVEIV